MSDRFDDINAPDDAQIIHAVPRSFEARLDALFAALPSAPDAQATQTAALREGLDTILDLIDRVATLPTSSVATSRWQLETVPFPQDIGTLYAVYPTGTPTSRVEIHVDATGKPYVGGWHVGPPDGGQSYTFDLSAGLDGTGATLWDGITSRRIQIPGLRAAARWAARPAFAAALEALASIAVDFAVGEATQNKATAPPQPPAVPAQAATPPPVAPRSGVSVGDNWRLARTNSRGKKTTFPLRGTLTIGRGQDVHLRINDTQASRRHAQLTVTESGDCWVTDLGSANGTFVNGTRLTEPTRLQSGDILRIGKTKFTVLASA